MQVSSGRSSRARTAALILRSVKLRERLLVTSTIFLLLCLVTYPSLRNPGIDDLDSAHHLMDGYFFRDLLIDHPYHHFSAYVSAYYKQYPALGFVFWPPLVPVFFGIFCLFGGAHVLVVRLCMFCFGLSFALMFYALLRRQHSMWLGLAGVAAVVTVPGMVWSFNQIMLELPTLAVMCFAVLTYFSFLDHLHCAPSYGRALLCGVACAAVIYSKQPAWFLYCAVAVDFHFCRRQYYRRKEVWLAVGTVVVMSLPLVLFTAKFGHANLGQSVGNTTNRIMQQYQSIPRWSTAAWSYYPRLALPLLNPVLVTAALAAFVLAFLQKTFLRSNALWFGWIASAYLTFSYYDNRLPRHATFWWPAWVALAVAAIDAAAEVAPEKIAKFLPALLLLPVPFQLGSAWKKDFTDYRFVQAPITELFSLGNPGNVLIFGADKQVLTALIREHDIQRTVHVIRGERELTGTQGIRELCRKYRIGTVLVELPASPALDEPQNARDLSTMKVVLQSRMLRRGVTVPLLAYRYTGPMDAQMGDISLSTNLIE